MNRNDEINRLIDGDLTELERQALLDAAGHDRSLADEIESARQLAARLAHAREPAPSSLQVRLAGIARRQQRRSPLRWMAVAASVLIVTSSVVWMQQRSEQAEIARMEQDLQVAFYYLKKINGRTGRVVTRSIDRGVIEPLVDIAAGRPEPE